jgi:hypothetical protein
MKSILSVLILSAAFVLPAHGQKVEVDKHTGLVKVDGKESFYLTEKNKSIMQSDFALENLDHKELAYLKNEDEVEYTSGGKKTSTRFLMVFTESGNQCYLTGFNLITGYIKPIAKRIAGANLVQDGAVSDMEERKFIVLHNGTFVKEAAPQQAERTIVVNNTRPANNTPAAISLRENKIYNNSELVGVFKRLVENGISTLSVYNSNDVLVCSATHEDGNENADWHIQYDGNTATILFNTAAPLEKLFAYLVEKGIL